LKAALIETEGWIQLLRQSGADFFVQNESQKKGSATGITKRLKNILNTL